MRQAAVFVESLITLDWDAPDFSTLDCNQTQLLWIPQPGSQCPLHLLVDSTAIKVAAEGELNAGKHGGPKHHV